MVRIIHISIMFYLISIKLNITTHYGKINTCFFTYGDTREQIWRMFNAVHMVFNTYTQ